MLNPQTNTVHPASVHPAVSAELGENNIYLLETFTHTNLLLNCYSWKYKGLEFVVICRTTYQIRILTSRLQPRMHECVTEQTRGVWGSEQHTITKRILPFSLGVPPQLLGSPCPPPEKRHLSMPETGEKERNYLFKSYTDLE